MTSTTIDATPATLTFDEAAAFVNMSRRSLERLMAAGTGPAAYREGKRYRFLRGALLNWLEKRAEQNRLTVA